MLTTIIRTKNNENTISEVLESIKDLGEVVVLDEHSSDDTVLIAKEYKAQIIYYSAIDFSDSLNQVISEVQNDWILFLEGDEIVPDKLGQTILGYIEKPKKNKNAIYIQRKLFYLDREIKADRKLCLKLFKKATAELINDYSTNFKPIKTKKYKLNLGFKNDKNCILKFEKRSIYNVIEELTEKNIIKSKDINIKDASIFLKPFFKFLYFYFVKSALFDGKRGFIYSFLSAFDCFISECNKYENIKKG